MPHKDAAKSAAYKAEWAKTPSGIRSKAASQERYRVTTKGIMARTRQYAKEKGGAPGGI